MSRFRRLVYLASMAVFFLLGILLSSCTNKGPDLSGELSALQIDPATGALSSIQLKVQNNTSSDEPIDFAVRYGNASTFWDASNFAGNLAGHSNRELTLRPEAGTLLPQVGDVVFVYAIRRDTGAEIFLGGKALEGRTSRLLNADFAEWRSDGSLPRAWTGPTSDKNASINIRQVSISGQRGVEVGVSSSQPEQWHIAFLQQTVSIDKLHVTALIYPHEGCDSTNPTPRSLLGIQYADDIGNTMLFCVSPGLQRPHVEQLNAGHQLTIGLPGHLDQWNLIDADPAKFREIIRLHGDKLGLVQLRAYVAINPARGGRRSNEMRASAVFGKFTQRS